MLGFLRRDLRPHPVGQQQPPPEVRTRFRAVALAQRIGSFRSRVPVNAATSVGPSPAFNWRVTSWMLIRTVPPCAPATVGTLMPPVCHPKPTRSPSMATADRVAGPVHPSAWWATEI